MGLSPGRPAAARAQRLELDVLSTGSFRREWPSREAREACHAADGRQGRSLQAPVLRARPGLCTGGRVFSGTTPPTALLPLDTQCPCAQMPRWRFWVLPPSFREAVCTSSSLRLFKCHFTESQGQTFSLQFLNTTLSAMCCHNVTPSTVSLTGEHHKPPESFAAGPTFPGKLRLVCSVPQQTPVPAPVLESLRKSMGQLHTQSPLQVTSRAQPGWRLLPLTRGRPCLPQHPLEMCLPASS